MSSTPIGMLEKVQDKIEWYEAELERLKEVIREQDRRAGTITARASLRSAKGHDHRVFIVTCPSGDEYALMRAMFAGFASVAFGAFGDACEALRQHDADDWQDVARKLFDVDEPTSPEPEQ